MGHVFYRYTQVVPADDFVRPLYGCLGDLRDGAVPDWAEAKRVKKDTLRRHLGYDYDDPVPRDVMADLQRAYSRGSFVEYDIPPALYLERQREKHCDTAYDTERRGDVFFPVDGLPADISDRVSEIMSSYKWEVTFNGPDKSFREWKLNYVLGNRGGIRDAWLVADVHI